MGVNHQAGGSVGGGEKAALEMLLRDWSPLELETPPGLCGECKHEAATLSYTFSVAPLT